MFKCKIFNILFSYEDNEIGRFSSLHLCTFKYFWSLLCRIRRLNHYLRFYFRKPKIEWTWTNSYAGLVNLKSTCNPVSYGNVTSVLHKLYMLRERNHFLGFFSVVFSPFFLTNIQLDDLLGTCLRIYLWGVMTYFREYLCTEELEAF